MKSFTIKEAHRAGPDDLKVWIIRSDDGGRESVAVSNAELIWELLMGLGGPAPTLAKCEHLIDGTDPI